MARDLGQLVEEQHAAVGERQLAGPGRGAAADQAGARERMVGRAERPPAHEAEPGWPEPRDRVQAGDGERLLGRERRQDAGKPPREHGLAHAGRAHHEQVMAPGGGDLEGAARHDLTAHLGKVALAPRVGIGRRGGLARQFRAAQPAHRLGQCRHRMDGEALDQRGLGCRRGGAQQRGGPGAPRCLRERQGAAHAAQRAVERQLAERGHALESGARRLIGRDQDAERHREVGGRTLLAAVGGGEVHRDAAVGKLEAGVAQSGPHAVAGLARGGVGQADEDETR